MELTVKDGKAKSVKLNDIKAEKNGLSNPQSIEAIEKKKNLEQAMAKHSSNYIVTKWLLQNELKQDIIERKVKLEKNVNKLNAKKNVFLKMFSSRDSKGQDEVDDYWQDNTDVLTHSERTPEEIAAILTIQSSIRFWKRLSVFREIQKKGGKNMETVLILQSAIRRFYSKAVAKEIESAQADQRNSFKQFCTQLKVGIEILQYSKDLGRPVTAKMLLSSDLNSIVMKFSRFSSKTISIKDMFQVKKGPSGFDYVSAKPSHTQWCFHIFLLSGESIDFEALNIEDFKVIYLGLLHIHLHAYTQAAFYIDKQGIPRRACPSIIKFALESKEETAGPRLTSEADRERYRTALQALKHEYSKWNQQLKMEMQKNKENKNKYESSDKKGGGEVDKEAAADAEGEGEDKVVAQGENEVSYGDDEGENYDESSDDEDDESSDDEDDESSDDENDESSNDDDSSDNSSDDGSDEDESSAESHSDVSESESANTSTQA